MSDNYENIQMRNCIKCGRQFPAKGKFCPFCGNPSGVYSQTHDDRISWNATASILTNTTILKQLIFGLGLAVFLLVMFMFFLGLFDGTLNYEYLIFLLKLFTYMFLGFGTMTVIGVLLFFGNKYVYTFTIDNRGITEDAQFRQRRLNNLLNALLGIAAIFSRSPGAMGTAILAQSGQKQFLSWQDINSVETKPGRREIILKKNRRIRMVVFCNNENYETVYQMIKQNTAGR